jgi:hypothetical protein
MYLEILSWQAADAVAGRITGIPTVPILRVKRATLRVKRATYPAPVKFSTPLTMSPQEHVTRRTLRSFS